MTKPTAADRELAEEIFNRQCDTLPNVLQIDTTASLIAAHTARQVEQATAGLREEIVNLKTMLREGLSEIDTAYQRGGFLRAFTSSQRMKFEAAINSQTTP